MYIYFIEIISHSQGSDITEDISARKGSKVSVIFINKPETSTRKIDGYY